MDNSKLILKILAPPKKKKVNIMKLFHIMPNGELMTGKTHNKNSNVIKKGKAKKKSSY